VRAAALEQSTGYTILDNRRADARDEGREILRMGKRLALRSRDLETTACMGANESIFVVEDRDRFGCSDGRQPQNTKLKAPSAVGGGSATVCDRHRAGYRILRSSWTTTQPGPCYIGNYMKWRHSLTPARGSVSHMANLSWSCIQDCQHTSRSCMDEENTIPPRVK
jgi:hypothetical protein